MQNYDVKYIELYYKDLEKAVNYISNDLNNPQAAINLLEKIEEAIDKRKDFAESFEPYRTNRNRKDKYYRIYVDNYVIFYVVLNGEGGQKIMEMRRLLYYRRQFTKH